MVFAYRGAQFEGGGGVAFVKGGFGPFVWVFGCDG
jgi:hypothetical protein